VAWRWCKSAGHAIEIRQQSIWWIKYQLHGRPQCVSSRSHKKDVAKRLLKLREGDVEKGMPITAEVNRITFDQAADDLINDYTTNKRRSLRVLTLRLKKHLKPFFTKRRLMTISTLDVRAYTAKRQAVLVGFDKATVMTTPRKPQQLHALRCNAVRSGSSCGHYYTRWRRRADPRERVEHLFSRNVCAFAAAPRVKGDVVDRHDAHQATISAEDR
jgi:hypothetical protein